MAHLMNVQAATKAANGGETLSGTRVLTKAEVLETTIFTFATNGAARNVDLPTPDADLAGCMVIIHNAASAAEVITIRSGPGGSTVCTPTQNENALCWCTGTIWRGGQMVGS